MAKSVVELGVNDNGFNAKIRNAMRLFSQISQSASVAKGSFTKMADGLAKVAQSQQLVNAALKGNPYGLLASAATAAFTKIIEVATEATEAERLQMEWAQKKAEMSKQANEAIGRSTGELMARYEMLRVTWLNLSSDQERNDWIKQNQSAFKGLNLAVNDVTSAENVFVKNTSQVVSALKARAEAEAYGELYKEQIKKNAMKKATGAYNPKTIDANYRPTLREAELAGLTNADYEHVTKQTWSIPKGGWVDYSENTGRLNRSGIQKLQALRNMGATALEMADQQDATYWANLMAQAQANANALGQGLFGPTNGGGGWKSGSKTSPFDVALRSWGKAVNKAGNGADALKGSDIKESMSVWAMMSDEAKKSMLGLAEATEDLGDAQARLGEQKVAEEIAQRTKLIEQQYKAMNLAAQSASNFGKALASLDNPAAQAAGTVISAIANIALGFGQAVAQAGSMGPWAWLAYVAAGTAALATTISTVHSLTGYAEGGIVKGNHYSGDMLDGGSFGINAGELVLNKAQQGALANELSNGGMRTLHVVGRISGTDIILSADRSLRLQGKELAVWGRG